MFETVKVWMDVCKYSFKVCLHSEAMGSIVDIALLKQVMDKPRQIILRGICVWRRFAPPVYLECPPE